MNYWCTTRNADHKQLLLVDKEKTIFFAINEGL